jgi:hypothetical protein
MKKNKNQFKDKLLTKKNTNKKTTHTKKQKGGDIIKESNQSRNFLNALKMTGTSKELEKKVEGTPYYPGPMPIPDCTIM